MVFCLQHSDMQGFSIGFSSEDGEEERIIGSGENTPGNKVHVPESKTDNNHSRQKPEVKKINNDISALRNLKKNVADLNIKLETRDEEILHLRAELVAQNNQLEFKCRKLTDSHQAAIEELKDCHQAAIKAKEASFVESTQQWEKEKDALNKKLSKAQEHLDQESKRFGIALEKCVAVEGELVKAREIQREKDREYNLTVEQLKKDVEEVVEEKNDLQKQLHTARDRNFFFNQIKIHKKEKDAMLRRAEAAEARVKELTLEREQLKNTTAATNLQTEALPAKIDSETLKQKQEEIENDKDEIVKLQALIQQLENDHSTHIENLTVKITKEVQDQLQREFDDKCTRKLKEAVTKERDQHQKTLDELNKKHQNELAQQRDQKRRLELKYISEQPTIKDEDSLNSSPKQLKNVKIDTKHQQKLIELQQENHALKQRVSEVQHDLEHQKEQFKQLQVLQVMMKRHLTNAVNSIGDVSI